MLNHDPIFKLVEHFVQKLDVSSTLGLHGDLASHCQSEKAQNLHHMVLSRMLKRINLNPMSNRDLFLLSAFLITSRRVDVGKKPAWAFSIFLAEADCFFRFTGDGSVAIPSFLRKRPDSIFIGTNYAF